MGISFDKMVVCPVLVGRTPYISALDSLIGAVSEGQGRALLVSGEAGIGKSRLASEAVSRVRPLGWQMLQGNCFETDRTLPYAPLLDLLRSFTASRSSKEIGALWSDTAPELLKLLPEMAGHFPGAEVSASMPPEQEKRRLFEALAQSLLRPATSAPLLLTIEDLHWCDDTSLEFLLLFARRAMRRPVLMLFTYRSDEVDAALAHFLAQVDREHLGTELALNCLTLPDASNMLRAIFDLQRPVRREFLEAIYTLTEGNPFFIEEVLKSLVASGDIFYADGTWDRKPINELRIPRSVYDAVQRRSGQLSADAGLVLSLAAAVGRRFSFSLLRALTGFEEGYLLSLVKELAAAQLVVEELVDNFTFRHALTQRAVYSQLLLRERKALHARIAGALEELSAASPGIYQDLYSADLAYHYFEAGIWDKALDYSQRVGEKAYSLYAPRAAVEHFTRALEAARNLGGEAPHSLYRLRGQAYETLGDFERARADFEQSLAAARDAGDRVGEWHSLSGLGFLWAGRDYSRSGAFYREAADVAQALGDPLLRAHSLNRLANWLVNTGQPADGIRLHHEALAIFCAEADVAGEAETLDLLGMATGIYGDQVRCVEHYRRAIKLFRGLNDPLVLASSLASLGIYAGPATDETMYGACAQMGECDGEFEEALRLSRQLDSPASEAYAACAAATTFGAFGDLGRALAQARQALRVATEIEHQQWAVFARWALGRAYLAALAPAEAIGALSAGLELAIKVQSAWWTGNFTSYLAFAHLLAGDIDSADRVLRRSMPPDALPRSSQERRMCWAWGAVALARGARAEALNIADELIASVPVSPVPRDGSEEASVALHPQHIPALLLLRGEALAGLGRTDEAALALQDAVEGAERRGARPLLWKTLGELAYLHKVAGHEEQAAEYSAQVQAVVLSMAETLPEDEGDMREHFVSAALASLPPGRAVDPPREVRKTPGGLTGREYEVALLVAQGKSNREIASQIFVTERTVEGHVSNILAKLGFTNRAQVVAWVVQEAH